MTQLTKKVKIRAKTRYLRGFILEVVKRCPEKENASHHCEVSLGFPVLRLV